MTHPTDDELEAMAERFDRWHQYGYKMPSHIQADGDDAAAMLRACKGDRNASPSPDVRELEWSEIRDPNEYCRYHHIIAESALGDYSIQWKGWKDNDDRTVFLAGDYLMSCGDDLEAAKAAAQADYERRILAALKETDT